MSAEILRFPAPNKYKTAQVFRSAEKIRDLYPEEAMMLYKEAYMLMRSEAIHRERFIRLLLKIHNKYRKVK